MKTVELRKAAGLKGEVVTPPDKSISHRAAIFSSISNGKSRLRNYLRAEDTMSTLRAFRALGAHITEERNGDVIIEGRGLHGLTEARDVIDCGNSGTTIRLTSGIVAGNPFFSVLTGDDSLKSRPMGRVIKPLKSMGASIMARADGAYPPIAIRGGGLKAIDYEMPMSSAQVKTCLILAALYADGVSTINEPVKSRDHTERMLPAFGAGVVTEDTKVIVTPGGELAGMDITVPGDFSSAAFFIVAALLCENSDLIIRGVGLNPTRTGLLDALRMMGARIEVENPRDVSGEPVGDLHVKGRAWLKAIDVDGTMVPAMIDEIPALCIAAAMAEGVTHIREAGELRVKESDRIKAVADGLKTMGVNVEEHDDGLSIEGTQSLKGGEIYSHGDHRIAMAFAAASFAAEGHTIIRGAEAVDISFPGFFEMLMRLAA